MSLAETPDSGSAPVPWHAMSAEEVEKTLRVDPNRGLDAAEAAERLRTYGPNRLPQGKKQGPLMRFLAQFNNILVYVLLTAGFIKLMLSLWLDASIIFAVVVLNSLLGFLQEGRAEKALELDPQHALRRGARCSRRRDPAHPRRGSYAGRHRPSRVRRQDPGRLASHGRQEPAHGRSGADWRVRPRGEVDRRGARKGDGRRPREHGLLRHDGRVGTRDRRRGRDRQPDGARPHQPDAR